MTLNAGWKRGAADGTGSRNIYVRCEATEIFWLPQHTGEFGHVIVAFAGTCGLVARSCNALQERVHQWFPQSVKFL